MPNAYHNEWYCLVKIYAAAEKEKSVFSDEKCLRRYENDMKRGAERFGIPLIKMTSAGRYFVILLGKTYDGDVENMIRFSNSSLLTAFRKYLGKVHFEKKILYFDSREKAEKAWEEAVNN